MAPSKRLPSRLTRSKSKQPPSSTSKRSQGPQTRREPDIVEEEEEPEPTSSFNGKLEHFSYADNTAPSSAAAEEEAATSLANSHTSPLKRAAASSSMASYNQSPPKKRRLPSRYAPPSKYAHLKPLQDIFAPDLIAVFVGTNPGVQTARDGHAYAHKSNSFWKMLHVSGLTDRRLRPEEDGTLPERYSLGNTNIVSRPSKDAAELSREEMAAGTPVLEEKVRRWRPEAVCIVGKGIWESVWRWRYGRGLKKEEFEFGWQEERENMGKCKDWGGARVYVTPSTSGLAASLKPAEKEALWMPFGEWVMRRRRERKEAEQLN